jgi:ATP:corrinoid adenosyltransferase
LISTAIRVFQPIGKAKPTAYYGIELSIAADGSDVATGRMMKGQEGFIDRRSGLY